MREEQSKANQPVNKQNPGPPQTGGPTGDIESLLKALKEAEEKYESFLEEIEDGYIELDLAGRLTFFNSAFSHFLGYPENTLTGMSYKEYIKADNVDRVFQAFNRVFKTGQSNKAFDYEIIRADGAVRIGELSISLKRNEKDQPNGFRCIVRDITKRKFAEQELETHRSRLEAIFRSVNDAIITVDTQMNVIEANTSTLSICGMNVDGLVGNALIKGDNRCGGRCFAVLEKTLKDKKAVRDYRIECAHEAQPQQKVSISTSPLLDKHDRFLGAVLVIKDITRLSDLERELKSRHTFQNIVGTSKKIQEIFWLLEDLSSIETTVLLTGESGTGKELAARAIHYSGTRAFKPFVTVNCSALSENLLESELFGHVKGSFTGAIRDTKGRFQTANGGTILLDEIGDISPRIQLKLLRVLQEKEFERVGHPDPVKVDIRIIASTNKDLRELVNNGTFREDLYYRLKVVEIELPPLRERTEDIQLLVSHFIKIFNQKFNREIVHIADEVMHFFLNYSWPGNVRELEHALERAFVLCREEVIELGHIPPEILSSKVFHPALMKRENADSPNELREALEKAGWNKTKAARLLGVNRRTIYRRMTKYQLSPPEDLL